MYTRRFGNWTVSPGIKFRFYKKDYAGIVRLSEYPGYYYTMRIPLIMVKYDVSHETDITFGFQGLPGVEFDYKNYLQSENDFELKTYIFQIQNRTVYFGYNIFASTGIKYNHFTFLEQKRAFENYKSTTTFVNIVLGWD